ncbi:hypothetical protein ACFKHW_38955 (plasmid) [Bradyrhizobium lupini]|uniref:hypothetical protein n=1 Tax=Rhizobium lupini TaxID=136996 RepID=UPI00366F7A53
MNGAASGIMVLLASEAAVALKNPDAIAVIVTALRLSRGDEAARAMLVGGMSCPR